MARTGLDFALRASFSSDMAGQSAVADGTSITAKLLSKIWLSLDEADQLATSAAALKSLHGSRLSPIRPPCLPAPWSSPSSLPMNSCKAARFHWT